MSITYTVSEPIQLGTYPSIEEAMALAPSGFCCSVPFPGKETASEFQIKKEADGAVHFTFDFHTMRMGAYVYKCLDDVKKSIWENNTSYDCAWDFVWGKTTLVAHDAPVDVLLQLVIDAITKQQKIILEEQGCAQVEPEEEEEGDNQPQSEQVTGMEKETYDIPTVNVDASMYFARKEDTGNCFLKLKDKATSGVLTACYRHVVKDGWATVSMNPEGLPVHVDGYYDLFYSLTDAVSKALPHSLGKRCSASLHEDETIEFEAAALSPKEFARLFANTLLLFKALPDGTFAAASEGEPDETGCCKPSKEEEDNQPDWLGLFGKFTEETEALKDKRKIIWSCGGTPACYEEDDRVQDDNYAEEYAAHWLADCEALREAVKQEQGDDYVPPPEIDIEWYLASVASQGAVRGTVEYDILEDKDGLLDKYEGVVHFNTHTPSPMPKKPAPKNLKKLPDNFNATGERKQMGWKGNDE